MRMTSGSDLDVPLQIYINLKSKMQTQIMSTNEICEKTQRELMINLNLG